MELQRETIEYPEPVWIDNRVPKPEWLIDKKISIDTETTGLDIVRDTVTHGSWAYRRTDGKMISGVTTNMEKLKEIAEDFATLKIYHTMPYDTHLMMNMGIQPFGFHFDINVGSFLVDENPSHRLDAIGKRFIGMGKVDEWKNLKKKGDPRQNSLPGVDEERERKYCEYARGDAIITHLSYYEIEQRLREEEWMAGKDFYQYYSMYERDLAMTLFAIERRGMLIDREFCESVQPLLRKQIQHNASIVYQWAGYEVDLNSPAKIANLLYDEKGLPVYKRTRTKGRSTDKDALKLLIVNNHHPEQINALLNYALNNMLLNTFVSPMLRKIDSSNYIHTRYNQAIAKTGRLSSSDPNLQNIPSKQDIISLRSAFTAPPGYDVGRADYDQVELRITAMEANDPVMMSILLQGGDIHSETAAAISGQPLSQFPKEVADKMRSDAKTLNFGVLYGMGAATFAKNTGMKLPDAKDYIKAYFERHPGISMAKRNIEEALAINGYVNTSLGRRRHIYNPEDYYKGFNSVVQGGARDVIICAQIKLENDKELRDMEFRQRMQVHDEIVFTHPTENRRPVMKRVKHIMETAYPIPCTVPLKVSMSVGPTWDETK